MLDIVLLASLALFSYLLGSIPFGLILSRWFGVGDLRTFGSGNIGATNALRAGGKRLGILTLCCDMLKGAVPVLIAKYSGLPISEQAVVGLAAVIGHIFPVWLKFQGGKGVATALAIFFTLHMPFGLIMIIAWLLVFALTKISSLSSLISILSTAMFITFVHHDLVLVIVVWLLTFLIVYKHKSNILRLVHGHETGFKK